MLLGLGALLLGCVFFSISFTCREVSPLTWLDGHQQLQAHILRTWREGESFSFLIIPLLGLGLISPTWVMSLGWKLLVTSGPLRRVGVHNPFYPDHLDSKSGRRSSLQRGIIKVSPWKGWWGGDSLAIEITDGHSLLLKCYCSFAFMCKVVFGNLEEKTFPRLVLPV